MSTTDHRKQSLYFPEDMLDEIQHEATRQDRSISWIVQQAWKVSRVDIRKMPSVNDVITPRPTPTPMPAPTLTVAPPPPPTPTSAPQATMSQPTIVSTKP